jgi:predicted ATPase
MRTQHETVHMSRAAGVIRTPDQRLRVFVSSTLKELAPERRAVRAAIERLTMAPVMFELGARPHPPRELYRAYLEQSDIFVGIYWEQYGWVAPGEDVSGLEDEWNFAPDIPKLIYLKATEHRQERLEQLLAHIRSDDHASYVAFTDAAELTELVTGDLATLLAERFDMTDLRRGPLPEPEIGVASTELVGLPSPRTTLHGRERESTDVARLLSRGQRLVTITGPGGIGKSRLAVASARAAEALFPDGIAFVDLARVASVDHVLAAVANALGIRDIGDHSLEEAIRVSLGDRRMLLLLDNVEHVVGAAPELGALMDGSAVSFLATSRVPLRLDGEVIVELGPLDPAAATTVFMERARAVKPTFAKTLENAESIASIVTALDRVPLALELAAARMRVMTPSAVADRLDHALPLLADGGRDLPERQRTIRATIEWSARLLEDDVRRLLIRLGVFRSGFALEAALWMADDLGTTQAFDAVSALVEGNLIREHDHGQRTWYTMPATIREYAREELEVAGGLGEARDQHARFYLEFADRAGRALTTPEQRLWMPRLVDERDEFRAAIEHMITSGHLDEAAACIWPLIYFWWVGGQLTEASSWAVRILEAERPLSSRSHAIATTFACLAVRQAHSDFRMRRSLVRAAKTFRREGDRFSEATTLASLSLARLNRPIPDYLSALRDANRSYALMKAIPDPFGQSVSDTTLGFLALFRRDFAGARRRFDEVMRIARSIDDRFFEGVAQLFLGWIELFTDDLDGALVRFGEQMRICTEIGSEEGIAFSLEGLFAVAAKRGEIVTAGRFLGAAEVVRERKGFYWNQQFSFHSRILDRIRRGPDAHRLEEGRAAGREADLDEIVAEALQEAHSEPLAATS